MLIYVTFQSIRAWDVVSMSCRGKFENEGESAASEISTMTYIPGTRALITGHHNGALYWWNTVCLQNCRMLQLLNWLVSVTHDRCEQDNASNTKLPQAHSDAVTKIHHYSSGNKEILFR